MNLPKINNSRDKIDCVLIGEIHFFTQEQVWQLAEIFDELNIPVICYGLRTNYLGHPFETAALLLAIADTSKRSKQFVIVVKRQALT